jgi:hypothetical protein
LNASEHVISVNYDSLSARMKAMLNQKKVELAYHIDHLAWLEEKYDAVSKQLDLTKV